MTGPNAELAYRVLDQIDAHPELHRQSWWLTVLDCGTAACFAGWASILSGDKPAIHFSAFGNESSYVKVGDDSAFVGDRATDLLGLTIKQRQDLFDAENTREDLGRLVAEIFGPRPAVTA